MVDDVRRVKGPTIPTQRPAQDRGDIPGRGVRERLTLLPTGKDGPAVDAALQDVAKLIRGFAGVNKKAWNKAKVAALTLAIQKALSQKSKSAAAREHVDAWAVEAATKEMVGQLREWVGYVGITADDADTDGLSELAKLLWPQSKKGKGSSFKKGSALRGAVKSGVVAKLVDDAVRAASLLAAKRTLGEATAGAPALTEVLNQFARMSLDQMARALRRKRRKLQKKKKDEEEAIAEHARVEAIEGRDPDEEPDRDRANDVERMVDLFCDRGLDTMHVVREEIAPKWSKEQQPYLLREADSHVVDILKSGAEEEELEATKTWIAIQELRDTPVVIDVDPSEEVTLIMKNR